MTIVYSGTNLSLAQPTTGTESGVWGGDVNNGLTAYVDIAIAGTLTLNGDGAVTLANTNGDNSATNIGATTAQYAILKITGTLTATKVITAPSYSKTYIVVNAATGGTVTIKASGQSGVSVAVGETATVYYNGTDYVKSATTLSGTGTVTSVAASVPAFLSIAGSPITTSGTLAITYSGTALPTANGGTALTSFTSGGALYATSTSALTTGTLPVASGGTGLTSGTSGGVLYYSATGTLASSSALTANALVIGGGAGAAPTVTTTATGALTFLGTPSSANLAALVTDETGSGSLVFATSPTLVTPIIGTPTSGNLSNCTADGTTAVGFLSIPQNAQTGSYTLVLADAGKHIYHATAAAAATYTIPANVVLRIQLVQQLLF
jgi:hypothetical protein